MYFFSGFNLIYIFFFFEFSSRDLFLIIYRIQIIRNFYAPKKFKLHSIHYPQPLHDSKVCVECYFCKFKLFERKLKFWIEKYFCCWRYIPSLNNLFFFTFYFCREKGFLPGRSKVYYSSSDLAINTTIKIFLCAWLTQIIFLFWSD